MSEVQSQAWEASKATANPENWEITQTFLLKTSVLFAQKYTLYLVLKLFLTACIPYSAFATPLCEKLAMALVSSLD